MVVDVALSKQDTNCSFNVIVSLPIFKLFGSTSVWSRQMSVFFVNEFSTTLLYVSSSDLFCI